MRELQQRDRLDDKEQVNVEISSMHVENFLSFKEATFDFRDVGLVLVEGENHDDDSARSNGSGKSSMLDALAWCLFGKTLRGYEHDEVVHRKIGEGCLVKVCLTDGDELYTISRARRHPRLKNSLTVTHDNAGEDVSGSGDKETQLVIERLLKCTLKTFLSSVIFGQDRAYRFSGLTDAEQKKILDEVIGVERFARACVAARGQVSEIQVERERVERDLERAERDRDEAVAEAADLEASDIDFTTSQRRKVEAERDKLKTAKDWVKKNDKVDVADLKGVLDAAQHAVTLYERKLAKATEADAVSASRLWPIQNRQAENEKLLRESDRLGGDCPTCGQKPTKRLVALIAEARAKSKQLMTEAAEASKQRDAAAAALGIAKAKLKDARVALTDAQAAYNKGVGVSVDAAAWRRRVADHEERVAELGRETNPYAELAAKACARHDKHAAEAESFASQVSRLEVQLKRAEFWVKAYGASGLRSLLVDTSLPLLNEEASRVSRAITGGSIKIEFSATSEQKSGKVVDRFEVRVDNKHGAGTYAGNSAGERAKIDLCVGLALQRLVASRSSASFNVVFYDEVFDHLDSAAHERVIEVLASLDKESVYVISHNEDLKAFFPATLRIVKRGGFSSVEA